MIVVLDREFRMYDSDNEEISYAISELEKAVERKQITNADRIRNMSDEELAEFLCKLDTTGSNPKSVWNGEFWIDEGEELLKWLQAEAKEGAE